MKQGNEQSDRRIRKALAALAVVAAVGGPIALTATPAQATANRPCPTYMCGSGNHNEEGAEDA